MSSMNSRALFTSIAVGAGVLFAGAGILLYEYFFNEKRRLLLQKEIYTLERCLNKIQREIESLGLINANRLRDLNARTARSITYSVTGSTGDDSEEEFFDFSDDENPGLEDVKKEFVDDKFEIIDKMLDGKEEEKIKAYGLLLDLNEKEEKNKDILWRLAKVCHALAKEMKLHHNNAKEQDYLDKGIQYALECLQVAPRSSDSHKWYAICIGARCEYKSNKEKLFDGLAFLKHIEEALSITPNDPTLHYLHGRYKYEVASLNWIERKLACALSGEVLESSYEEAVESLLRADKFSSEPWKENRVLLAKSFLKMGDIHQGLRWLERAEEGEIISPEDRVADAEVKKLRKCYKSQLALM